MFSESLTGRYSEIGKHRLARHGLLRHKLETGMLSYMSSNSSHTKSVHATKKTMVRERQIDRQTDRQTDTERQTQRDGERQRESII